MYGEGSSGRAGPGRANHGAKQLPRRASSSHLPLKFQEQGHITRRPEHHNKLVLLLFILVIGTFTVIIQHRLFLPVEGPHADPQLHRKHLRIENQDLREKFASHKVDSAYRTYNRNELKTATPAASEEEAQQGVDTEASNDIKLQHVPTGTESKAITNQNPTSSNLHWLNANISNAAAAVKEAVEAITEQIPAEDFSATGLDKKRQMVVEAAAHSWRGYEEHAWGSDELQPLTQDGKETLGGLGATIVDSLDTLWLMGLKDQFSRAREWVSTNLTCNSSRRISLFETNIRIVGGLLGAYELSQDVMFLDKAQGCVDLMLPMFDTSPTGIPNNMVVLKATGKKKPRLHGSLVSLAEYGTFGVEFQTLSDRTGNATYASSAAAVYRWVKDKFPGQGLLPTRLNRNKGSFAGTRTYTMGANADSYYEYLLKMWLLKQQKDEMYRAMWENSMDKMMTKLMATSVGGLLYVGLIQHSTMFDPRFEHLTCFLPGNLALGVAYGAVNGSKADMYMDVAKNLTYSCWQMYERMPTGLAPEMVWFHPTDDMQAGTVGNQLRPEVLESLFYLWRFTGDVRYQQWAWRIFQSFEKYSKVESGYAGLEDMTVVPPGHDNVMQSFWLAETLKYLFLLFSPPDVLPLDEWLFNTEAHPVRLRPPLHALLRPPDQHIVPLV